MSAAGIRLSAVAVVAAARARGRVAALPAVAAIALMVLVVGVHLALVGAGEWEGDEYYHFHFLEALGWTYLWHRLVAWAPRPVSEAILYGYWQAVRAVGRPLIGAFLALLWAGLIGAVLAPLWRAARPCLPRLLLGTTLLAAFLLGHTVAEVFYWPMGAAAYLPTLAAAACVTIAILDGRLDRGAGRAAIAVALAIGAGSSEVGAMFVAALLPLLLIADRLPRVGHSASRRPPVGWALVPLVLALAVIGLNMFGRVASNLTLAPGSPTLHHFWPSLRASLAEMAREIFALSPGNATPAALAQGAAVRILLLFGFRWCLRRGGFPPQPAGRIAALVLAMLATGFGSLLGGYELFGFHCCLRHDTMRECMDVLVLLALAGIGLGRREWRFERTIWFGPGALVAAALLAAGGRGAELIAAYRMYPSVVAAREATWSSGAGAGPELDFVNPPRSLTVQTQWPPGHYSTAAATPWYIWSPMAFFHKQSMRIVPARDRGPGQAPDRGRGPASAAASAAFRAP